MQTESDKTTSSNISATLAKVFFGLICGVLFIYTTMELYYEKTTVYLDIVHLPIDLKVQRPLDEIFNGGHGLSFLPQFKNPCFLDDYDPHIKDKDYYKNQALIQEISHFYVRDFSDGVQRATVQVEPGRQTKRLRCLPYYYVLGVAKSGTTDIYKRMHCHPHVQKSIRKASEYFDQGRFKNWPLSSYVDFFDPVADKVARYYRETKGSKVVPIIGGDHSVKTLFLQNRRRIDTNTSQHADPNTFDLDLLASSTAHLVHALTPEARFIVIMRNPIERAYSYYKMHHAKSPRHFHDSMLLALDIVQACFDKEGYSKHCLYDALSSKEVFKQRDLFDAIDTVRPGIYYPYIKEWLQVFPKERFLFLKAESYYADVYGHVTKQVYPFLDLEPLQRKSEKTCIKSREPTHVTSRLLHFDKHAIDVKYNEPMLPETVRILQDFYMPHVKALEQLLNSTDWSWW